MSTNNKLFFEGLNADNIIEAKGTPFHIVEHYLDHYTDEEERFIHEGTR